MFGNGARGRNLRPEDARQVTYAILPRNPAPPALNARRREAGRFFGPGFARCDRTPSRLEHIAYAEVTKREQEMMMPTAVPVLTMSPAISVRKDRQGFAAAVLVACLPFILAVFVTALTHHGQVSLATTADTFISAGQAMATAEAPDFDAAAAR
jgi:hypothetical protein